MTAAGLAPSAVEAYYRALAAIMLAARRDPLIAESPCERIALPRSERSSTSLVPLTTEQVRKLADAMPDRFWPRTSRSSRPARTD